MNRRAIITLFAVTAGATLAGQAITTQLGISEGRAKEAVFDSFMADAVSIAGKPAVFIGRHVPRRASRWSTSRPRSRARLSTATSSSAATPITARPTVPTRCRKNRPPTRSCQTARRIRASGRGDAQAVRSDSSPGTARHARRRLEAHARQLDEMEKGPSGARRSRACSRTQRAEQVTATRRGDEGVRKDLSPADPRALVAMRLRRSSTSRGRRLTAQLVERGQDAQGVRRPGPRGQARRVEDVLSGRKTRHRRRPGIRPEMAGRPPGRRRRSQRTAKIRVEPRPSAGSTPLRLP